MGQIVTMCRMVWMCPVRCFVVVSPITLTHMYCWLYNLLDVENDKIEHLMDEIVSNLKPVAASEPK